MAQHIRGFLEWRCANKVSDLKFFFVLLGEGLPAPDFLPIITDNLQPEFNYPMRRTFNLLAATSNVVILKELDYKLCGGAKSLNQHLVGCSQRLDLLPG